jgi:hypothetical protein
MFAPILKSVVLYLNTLKVNTHIFSKVSFIHSFNHSCMSSQILEDQLRLMDEKYMELRTKLDYTRQSTGRDVVKYKQQASQLRTKWALLSANMPGQPTLLDEVDTSGLTRDSGNESVNQTLSVSFGPETSEVGVFVGKGGRSRSQQFD